MFPSLGIPLLFLNCASFVTAALTAALLPNPLPIKKKNLNVLGRRLKRAAENFNISLSSLE